VIRCAEAGDAVAWDIVSGAAAEAVRSVAAVAARCSFSHDFDLVLAGPPCSFCHDFDLVLAGRPLPRSEPCGRLSVWGSVFVPLDHFWHSGKTIDLALAGLRLPSSPCSLF
jgi:hypothetical protein